MAPATLHHGARCPLRAAPHPWRLRAVRLLDSVSDPRRARRPHSLPQESRSAAGETQQWAPARAGGAEFSDTPRAIESPSASTGPPELSRQVEELRREMTEVSALVREQQETIRRLREELGVARRGGESENSDAASPSDDAPATQRRTLFWRPDQHAAHGTAGSRASGAGLWTPGSVPGMGEGLRAGPSSPLPDPSSDPTDHRGSLLETQARLAYYDRRLVGSFDARFHSASWGATPKDFRILPARIILVRHAQSEGNIDNAAYASIPDNKIPITELGRQQAMQAGAEIREELDRLYGGEDYKVFFYTSPYPPTAAPFKRTRRWRCWTPSGTTRSRGGRRRCSSGSRTSGTSRTRRASSGRRPSACASAASFTASRTASPGPTSTTASLLSKTRWSATSTRGDSPATARWCSSCTDWRSGCF